MDIQIQAYSPKTEKGEGKDGHGRNNAQVYGGKNRKLTHDTLKSKTKSLPLKQQLQVMACFNACKRSSTKGMKYQAEWILECLLMRMKSKRLYEHPRKKGIVLLPGRTCLQQYLHALI
ncbi:hypothetical protein HPB49_022612 [Dermacentor silvarum]|uniref:Uncharacterized protein n=1 Tax=Dermacentor silvarum TaxID=543639 RepID=A0ACB8DGI0_DERSI|nr:hypothetical protein HPB49_022612 [Dermacentor silvarum]